MVISKSDKIFDSVIIVTLIVIGLVCAFPLMYVLSMSLTPLTEVLKNGGFLVIPKNITFEAYNTLIKDEYMSKAMINTLLVTIVGTILSMVLSTLMAYPLSKKNLPLRRYIMIFIVFTMMFSGGIIPTYLLVKSLGMTNTYWSLIIPGCLSTYNIIVIKAFFESLPEEMFESARIDGAGEFRVLLKMVLPLSVPVLMTVGLFYMVSYWNVYFAAIMYITDKNLLTLQVVLRRMLMASASSENIEVALPTATLQMAAVIFASAPIIVVYPFIQKYFTKGMMLGAVKG